MGPWRQRYIDLLYVTLTYCLSEYTGSAVHFWNSHTKKRAMKWKTKAADFLPWKAEIPLSCNRQQRQCHWRTPWASQRNGKWQCRGATTLPGTVLVGQCQVPCPGSLGQLQHWRVCLLRRAVWSSPQSWSQLPACSRVPTSEEVFSCRYLLQGQIQKGSQVAFVGTPPVSFTLGWVFPVCSPLKSYFFSQASSAGG